MTRLPAKAGMCTQGSLLQQIYLPVLFYSWEQGIQIRILGLGTEADTPCLLKLTREARAKARA